VCLELALQAEPVRQQLGLVGRAHRLERLLAALPFGRPLEELERLAEATGDHGLEELLLRPEQPEDVGLGDAGTRGDRLRGGAVEPALRKLLERRVEDAPPPFLCGFPCRRCHYRAVSYYLLTTLSSRASPGNESL